MRCLEAVVANRAAGAHADMHDRHPTLELMVPSAMERVRRAYRKSNPRSFDSNKYSMMIDDPIAEQDLLPPAMPHVQRRKVIQRASPRHTREEPVIFAIPKSVRKLLIARLGF